MLYKIMSAALISAIGAAPALAQQFGGGSVAGQYKQFTDDDADLEILSFQGGAELEVGTSFALGGNISSFDNSERSDDEVLNTTLHAMYKASPNTGVGVFVAQDFSDASDSTNYGVEVGSASANGRFEAYFGWTDPDDIPNNDVTIAGLSFEFGLGNGFTLGLEYESFTIEDSIPTVDSLEDITFSDAALIARYQFGNGSSLFVEFGQISASSSDDVLDDELSGESEYVGIGAKYTFGRGGGNIFSDRTLIGFGG